MIKNKFKAFLIHFIISLIIVSFVLVCSVLIWFPTDYLELTRFSDIAKLIIFVDLILGPVLTFVVFNKNKKSLKFDLSIIAIIQVSALAYGTFNLYQSHPVFITFNQDRYTIINAREAKPENAKYDEYNVSKLSTANLAYAKMPEDDSRKQELIFEVLSGEPDLDERVEYYEPYHNHINSIINKSLDPKLLEIKIKEKSDLPKILSKSKDLNTYAYLPLVGSTKDAIIVLDKKSAKPVATIDIDPWQLTKK